MSVEHSLPSVAEEPTILPSRSFGGRIAPDEPGVMSEARLKEICRKDSLYSTAHLNDKLYLHYKGFRAIQNLDKYTGLRVLWLEGNGLTRIEGLEAQTDMRTLYLQENAIEEMEGLSHMSHLSSLNVSKNRISCIKGIAELTELNTLLIGHNELVDASDISALADHPALSCVDLQHNRLTDPAVIDVLCSMPTLTVLYLQGNPIVKSTKHYRKVLLGRLPRLLFLDDRPVFDDERRRTDAWYKAWLEGGDAAAAKAEREEVDAIAKQKDADELRNHLAFAEFVRRAADDTTVPSGAAISRDIIDPRVDAEAPVDDGKDDLGEFKDRPKPANVSSSVAVLHTPSHPTPTAIPVAETAQAEIARNERMARIVSLSDEYRSRAELGEEGYVGGGAGLAVAAAPLPPVTAAPPTGASITDVDSVE
jgi:hypothetical protein